MSLQGKLFICVSKALNLENADGYFAGKSDAFVEISLDKKRVARTFVVDDELNPKWNQDFLVNVEGNYNNLTFELWDYDPVNPDDFLGMVTVPVSAFANGKKYKGNSELLEANGKKKKGTLHFKIKYYSTEKLASASWVVYDNIFPPRRDCNVVLYQDAHTAFGEHDGPPKIIQSSFHKKVVNVRDFESKQGKTTKAKKKAPTAYKFVQPGNAWSDIYNHIMAAKKFIYITGWSVNTNMPLLRRGNNIITLGEILKKKSEQGVLINIMIWNEAMSISLGGSRYDGLMATHDEETIEFFSKTKVNCHGVYREGEAGSEYIWSHHQKSIILDSEDSTTGRSRVLAFMGGLDLCDGRWDTPGHALFTTLKKEHSMDFHNPFQIPSIQGPREPWHDIHCRLEGTVALDVMANFEQRWNKQVKKPDQLFDLKKDGTFLGIKYYQDCNFDAQSGRDGEVSKGSTSNEEIKKLLKMEKEKEKKRKQKEKGGDKEEVDEYEEDNVGNWVVQFFRSITPDSATIKHKECGIHHAYVNAIRKAKQFIYIENQYFLGATFAWHNDKPSGKGSFNRIPFEIASKVANKIRAGKDFQVYIVVPMFPEGDPVSKPMQEILRWQWNTMEMMYKHVAAALHDMGLTQKGAKPSDYIHFFCLGKRELVDDCAHHESYPSNLVHYFKAKRFMIYVHSKMMIVDDEFIIVGSANINERSMAGDRDTEIAMGAYEADQAFATEHTGAVHQFRMSLWSEHLGGCEDAFLRPWELATGKLVAAKAEKNWNDYISDGFKTMSGHLMRYPVICDAKGDVSAVVEKLPDTQAAVRGSPSTLVFDVLTQ